MTNFYTIEQFIDSDSGSRSISYHNFSILDQKEIDGETVQFIDINILDDYLDEMKDLSVPVQLSDKELAKYSYNPGLLAYDLYGSTELEFVILKLNGIIDPKDFDFPSIRLLEPQVMEDLLSNIYSSEAKYINDNREKYGIE